MPEPFFRREGDAFVPTPSCRGPWDPKSLHGRVVAGLLASEIERNYGGPDFQFARLTTDLWRLPGFDPITVETRLAREGGRIKVVDAECFAAGKSIGRASGVLLRKSQAPGGDVWVPDPWDFPKPDDIAPPPPSPNMPPNWEPMWETRSLGPAFGVGGRKRIWMREVRDMIEGQPITPIERVSMAADMASPMANSGSAGLQYINADITLYLHRLPQGEWIGLDVVEHGATDGVAVGECAVYDIHGPIGRSIVCALAQKRRD